MFSHRLRERVKIREEDFGGLAFIPATSEIVQLNHLGYRLLCQISESGQAGDHSSDTGYQSFLQTLVERGVIEEVKQ